jgi:SSS family solute:Na+ symporter
LPAKEAIRIGRIATGVFVVVGCLLAPYLANMGGIYEYMQRVWNFIWPGILAVFLFGILVPKAPKVGATWALLLSPPAYGAFMWIQAAYLNSGAYLNAAALAFLLSCAVLTVATVTRPLAEPRPLPDAGILDMRASPGAKIAGALIVALTVSLYVVFW